MSFNILAVHEAGSDDNPLYPVPDEAADRVEREEQDGEGLPPFVTGELRVYEIPSGGTPKRVLRVEKVKAAVTVNRSRVTVACSKYEKGGGWTPWSLGAVPVALTANAVSKVRASRRRRGKMLVGHVRYPWLLSVGLRASSTSLGHDTLRLGTVDQTLGSFRGLTLDISLPRQCSGVELAQRIARLAADYRLSNEGQELDDAMRERLTKLKDAPLLQPMPRKFASYFFVDTSRSDIAGFEAA